jgi:hypothetical protein
VKLLCSDANMPRLVTALADDAIPAVLMERTGTGWRVEFMATAPTPAVDQMLSIGLVQRSS